MKLYFYNICLRVLGWFIKGNVYENKRYLSVYRRKLSYNLNELHGEFKYFNLYFNNSWDYFFKYGKTTPTNIDLNIAMIDAGLRLASNMGVASMCGVQPLGRPYGKIYTMRYHSIPDPQRTESRLSLDGNTIKKEAVQGTRISLEVRNHVVSTARMRLSTGLSMESVERCSSDELSTFDVVADALAKQTDIDFMNWFINDVTEHSVNENITINTTDKVGVNRLLGYIIQQSNYIGLDTKRGVGNVVWASSKIVKLLHRHNFIQKNSRDPEKDSYSLQHEGKLSVLAGHTDVYTRHSAPDSDIIIGYKGCGTDVDVGVVFTPYIPIDSGALTMNPETVKPELSFFHIGSIYWGGDDKCEGLGIDSGVGYKYYRKITVEFPETGE